jgi:hypothetical protein
LIFSAFAGRTRDELASAMEDLQSCEAFRDGVPAVFRANVQFVRGMACYCENGGGHVEPDDDPYILKVPVEFE